MSDRDLSTLVGGGLTIGPADAGPRFPCSLIAVSGHVASLQPDDPAARGYVGGLAPATVLRISCTVPDGAYVADVEVTGWSPSRRVLTVVHRGTLEFVQRRAVFRVPVAVPVELLVERDGDLVAAEGSTIEMSTAGFSVPLTRDLRPGEQASAVLRLPGEPVMAVVRVVMPGATAKLPTRVRIDEIERTDLARLTTFLRRAEVRRVRTGPAR